MQMCLKIHTHTLLCTKLKAWVVKFVQSLGEQVRSCVKSDILRLLLFLFLIFFPPPPRFKTQEQTKGDG